MPKPDEPVQEVRCYKTGKPLPKVPQWLATVKVKFVSDEARQKEPPAPSILDSPAPLLARLPLVHDDDDADLSAAATLVEDEEIEDIAPEELDVEEEIEVEGELEEDSA
ncbi:hypothetical protein CWRG_02478 [Chthonomonas calidirosea]|uniref:Uncharacterized protein n=2 Tax=Chthonomonas TaxID=1077265 RepID=S0EVG5_CHTCT|nr:hypothetical protein CCALI_01600 [Chthonomonas calidirosea T49]CEK19357.1 hypothetical protein CP488_02495 [Chthonomonas calidirosea]CEK19359.1 hypothetical protein CWRG_02478 [Chthonomonas calidirosea]CEK20341.1 hypothetical protein CTKA_02500 [Chthonomonas calidirosea]